MLQMLISEKQILRLNSFSVKIFTDKDSAHEGITNVYATNKVVSKYKSLKKR